MSQPSYSLADVRSRLCMPWEVQLGPDANVIPTSMTEVLSEDNKTGIAIATN
jgi:hypothetical protein